MRNSGRLRRTALTQDNANLPAWRDPKTHSGRLELALNNMSQGLLMFDSNARIVVCNERYIDMYGLSRAVVKPGCTLRNLLCHRHETGSFPGDYESYCDNVLARVALGETSSFLIETSDGRTIHIVDRPMVGGGWVATHEDVSKQRRAEARVEHMAHHDALTNLPNRLLFRERLADALKWIARGEQLAVLYLDLDNFKSVNDTLGHPAGDTLLRQVADRLRGCVRDVDTVARLGGDEFAIVQTKIQQPSDAAELASRIRDAIMAPYQVFDHQVVIDTSIGISLAPGDSADSDHLLKNADMALYGAKAGGRGTFRFFEPEMDARITARRNLEIDLREALVRGEFELHYQPLVNLESNDISGCEALVRWHHPKRGMVSPIDFIPIAEETGLIVRLGEWVIRTACMQASKWPAEIKVAVNVSPVQFKNQNLAQVVISALAASGLAPKRLELEITETILMHNTGHTLATLHQLRELGVRIVMDDFGTGYSSMSYLRSFPFDKIKIDRSFIKDLSEQDDSAAIVRAVTGLANSFHMTTTAEGIETQQQRQIVEAAGCTEMQGYLFSRPKTAKDLASLFDEPAKTARTEVSEPLKDCAAYI